MNARPDTRMKAARGGIAFLALAVLYGLAIVFGWSAPRWTIGVAAGAAAFGLLVLIARTPRAPSIDLPGWTFATRLTLGGVGLALVIAGIVSDPRFWEAGVIVLVGTSIGIFRGKQRIK
ncbi:MAG TPA: hypothetical protein VHD91_01965 [Gaiellaceae bacterium]|nr:hypothetical protein [Gaiellaceae bacterium]